VSENSVVRPVSLPSFLDNLSTMLSVHGQRGEGEDERRYIRRKAGNLGGSGELGNIQSLLYARREWELEARGTSVQGYGHMHHLEGLVDSSVLFSFEW